MAYSSKIYPVKCHSCHNKAKMRVFSHRNELWGEYCIVHGNGILKMLKAEEARERIPTVEEAIRPTLDRPKVRQGYD